MATRAINEDKTIHFMELQLKEENMSEQNTNMGNDPQTGEKTFTQDDVNRIVQSRIVEVKNKYADYDDLKAKATKFDEMEEAEKTELQKATEKADALQAQLDQITKSNKVRDLRMKVSKETGVPYDLLSGDDEESCKRQAEAILKFANPNGYPKVKDSGEPSHVSGKKTRDLFKDWMNENF